MKKITKLFTSKAVEVDEKNRTAKFIISDDGVDRMNERVEQSWDLKNYEANPIVLWGHDPSQPENVMGNSLGIETEKDGEVSKTSSTVKFSEAGLNAKADMVFNMIKAGILRTVSVGFIPKTFKTDDDGNDVLADNELLEFSIVPIPANPRAVALAYKEGGISRKDANFMLSSMSKESELLQKELDNAKNNDKKEKEMSDEDIAKLAEALGTKVGEALAPVTEKLDAILEKVGADSGEDEEKPKPADAEGDENDEEEELANKSAKGGESDQPGADEVDEDSELTPEQEKEFEKEFEKSMKED